MACYFVGQAFLNANGQGQVFGYFTDINGIGSSDTLFNGSPSEQTAFFTFRSNVFSQTPLPLNGDIGLDLVSAGTFDIYYNPSTPTTPNRDWSNPDSFSSGQLVAHFMRPESLFVELTQSSQHVLTETLVSSQSFTFNGQRYDFRTLVPGGVTLNEFVSNTGVPGVTNFPVGFAYAGNCLAVVSTDQYQQ